MLISILIATLKGFFANKHEHYAPRLIFLGVVGLMFVAFVVAQRLGLDLTAGIVIGCLLSLTNAYLGYMFIERGFEFDDRLFVYFSLGGMALRFFLMIASSAVVLLLFNVHVAGFIFSFFASYILLLIVEIIYINKKIDIQKRKKNVNVPIMLADQL